MYLASLLTNLYDGRLQSPFTSMPADRWFEKDDLPFFEVNRKPEEPAENGVAREALDRELSLNEHDHVSSDGRTYVAIRSISNGNTLMGYVAVTIGRVGPGPSWTNAQGETV